MKSLDVLGTNVRFDTPVTAPVFGCALGITSRLFCFLLTVSASLLAVMPLPAASAPPRITVGVAKIDITPDLPIHLIGYANRPGECTELSQPLHARALAIGGENQRPVVIVTAELEGISDEISEAVAAALRQSHQLERAQVAVCITHTHTGPAIRGRLEFAFSEEMPSEVAARISRYTDMLIQRLVAVARAALADRKPGRLEWAEGSLAFAAQRRRIENGRWTGFGIVPGGPVDHTLPILRALDDEGRVRAVWLSYACHGTSLGGANVIHPDWAGEASAQIEKDHPGAVALVSLGCAGDGDPVPRGSIDAAKAIGKQVATEVTRVFSSSQRQLGFVTSATYREITLPLDHLVTRDELTLRVANASQPREAHVARQLLAKLDRGGQPWAAVTYPVQAWCFGDELAMVFLGGEVVSEYALRLRREFAVKRLWVNAYANSVQCYVPSKRMFAEGGYEVDGSIGKYGWPTRLASDTEERIVDTVHALLPATFRSDAGKLDDARR